MLIVSRGLRSCGVDVPLTTALEGQEAECTNVFQALQMAACKSRSWGYGYVRRVPKEKQALGSAVNRLFGSACFEVSRYIVDSSCNYSDDISDGPNTAED